MIKKIKILTHTDFDGAAFPYVLERMLDIYSSKNGIKYEVSMEYVDINNAHQILCRDFENLQNQGGIQDTYYLVLDVGNIGDAQKTADFIIEMEKKGLKFSYIDHHDSKNSQEMDQKLESMLFIKENTACASMMGYAALLGSFMDAAGIESAEEFFGGFGFDDDNIRIFAEQMESFEKTYLNKKFSYQKMFFKDMLGIGTFDLKDDKVIKDFGDSAMIIKAADFLDRGMVSKMYGLDVVRDYFNLAAEHLGKDVSKIFSSVKDVLNSPEGSHLWSQLKVMTKRMGKRFKQKERVEEAVKNVEFLSIKGRDGKNYNTAVFFAQGDIRYDIEGKRCCMDKVFEEIGIELFKVDFVVTATRFTIGHTPIMTIKPVEKGASMLEIAAETFKDKGLIRGVNAGIPVEYSKEDYAKMAENSTYIVKYKDSFEHKLAVELRREENKEILRNRVRDIFDFEVVKTKTVVKKDDFIFGR